MLTKISEFVMRLMARYESEKGQALAEYGLILALIAVVALAALTAIGLAVTGTLQNVADAMP